MVGINKNQPYDNNRNLSRSYKMGKDIKNIFYLIYIFFLKWKRQILIYKHGWMAESHTSLIAIFKNTPPDPER